MTIPTFNPGEVLTASGLNTALGAAAIEPTLTANTWAEAQTFNAANIWNAAQTFNAANIWNAAQTFDSTINQAPGQGTNNSSPFAQYGDLFSDAIVTTPTPAFPTSATLSSTAPALDAYVLGQRVAYAGGSYTVGASATSYLDLSNTGVLTVSTSGTVTANSLRLATVTSSATAITAVTLISASHPNATFNNLTTTGETYLATNGGSVGIGTETPASLFNAISGSNDFRFSNGAAGITPTISVISQASGSKAAALLAGSQASAVVFDQSGEFIIQADTKLNFDNNVLGDGTQVFSIDNTGNISIPGTVLSRLSVSSTTTAGAITLTAAQLAGGYFSDGATQTASFTVTTDTATNILAAMPNAAVGTAFRFRFINNDQSATGYAATLAGGAGVTVATTPLPNLSISKGAWAEFLFTFTSIGASPALTAAYVGQGTI